MVADPAEASRNNSRREDALEFAEAIFPPGATGIMFTAFGRDPVWTAEGKYEFPRGNWTERARDYPNGIGQAVDLMLKAARDNTDTYMCTGLAHKTRDSGSLKEIYTLHADWDGDADDRDACLAKVKEFGGFAIDSGTDGHLQCFIPLAEPIITAARYSTLCSAFAAKLPPGADSKIAWNDVMRVPGTHSLKSTVRPGDTGQPTLVTWAMKPTGGRMDIATIEKMLGVSKLDTPQPGAAAAPPGPYLIAEPPGGLACYPKVSEAIINPKLKDDGTIDRSATIMAINGACASSNLDLPHARWCVALRPDVRSKLDEQGSRDDVLECWLKAVSARQRARRERMTPGNPLGPNADDGGGVGVDMPPVDIEERVAEPSRPFGDVRHLEGDFWKRDSLATIYTAALSRMCSPWAVLGIAAARALTLVPPTWTLPALIGGPGSLNSFCAVVDKSGGGKDSAMAVAKALVNRTIVEKNIGSGEGLVKAYYPKPEKGQPMNPHTSILFNVNEVDTLGALGNRTGSTLMSTVRSGFSGSTLGFAYATEGKDHHLEAGAYRLTMVVGVQPKRAGTLLDDEAGGTPQRFMWFPANDVRISDNPPDWPGVTLTLPAFSDLKYANEIKIPGEARALILSERAKAARGQQDSLDGHALFCREKLAFALAMLDGRTEMNSEDWRLSGIAAEVSAYIRAQMVDILDQGRREQAATLGALRGVTQEAADNEKVTVKTEREQKMLRWLLEKLDAAGGRMTRRDLMNKADSRNRHALGLALILAMEHKLIRQDGASFEKVTN